MGNEKTRNFDSWEMTIQNSFHGSKVGTRSQDVIENTDTCRLRVTLTLINGGFLDHTHHPNVE